MNSKIKLIIPLILLISCFLTIQIPTGHAVTNVVGDSTNGGSHVLIDNDIYGYNITDELDVFPGIDPWYVTSISAELYQHSDGYGTVKAVLIDDDKVVNWTSSAQDANFGGMGGYGWLTWECPNGTVIDNNWILAVIGSNGSVAAMFGSAGIRFSDTTNVYASPTDPTDGVSTEYYAGKVYGMVTSEGVTGEGTSGGSTSEEVLSGHWQFGNGTAEPRYSVTGVTYAEWISNLTQGIPYSYIGFAWNTSVPYSDGTYYAYRTTGTYETLGTVEIANDTLSLYATGSVSNGFFLFDWTPAATQDDYYYGWVVNGTLDVGGVFSEIFVTIADNAEELGPLPTGGAYDPGSTDELIDTFTGYLIPLILFLLPALILGWLTHWEKWPILIGLAIGSGLTYLFLGTQYVWLVFLVTVGIGASAYQSSRGDH